MLLSFFAGTLLVTFLILLGSVIIPADDPKNKILDWEEVVLTLPVYRFFFMLNFVLFFVALDVYILRKFRVNYLFIFELDPHYKVTHIQLFRVSMMLFTIFMLFLML